ncbi:aldo/keto reductase [Streptomyces sp. NPDC000351]|uniref:aldo/keto reductase n=1 Tax=Streptomyces sp. NPDC000351 TaxID=3154250 RepID=UPI003317B22B
MEYRTIARTAVSAIGLGAMPLSIEHRPDETRAIATVHAALDAGVTLVDTADSYHWHADEAGHNELLIARALARYGGDTSHVLVATKGGRGRPGDGSWTVTATPAHLKQAAEASAKRLGVDAIGESHAQPCADVCHRPEVRARGGRWLRRSHAAGSALPLALAGRPEPSAPPHPRAAGARPRRRCRGRGGTTTAGPSLAYVVARLPLPLPGGVSSAVSAGRATCRATTSSWTSATAGQEIAECGNSGNSSEPHLHFQLMDGPDVMTARGVPFAWRYRDDDGVEHVGVPEDTRHCVPVAPLPDRSV